MYDWPLRQKFRHENEKKPDVVKTSGFFESGSSTWARTRDLRINSPSLYRLSYRGIEKEIITILESQVKHFLHFLAGQLDKHIQPPRERDQSRVCT